MYFLSAALALNLSLVVALIDCDDVLTEPSKAFIGLCNNKWKNLKPLIKPTQSQVGYAWIQRKLD